MVTDQEAAILYAVSYLLLFFAGEGPTFEPEPSLCLTQAAMTYAVCPLYVRTSGGVGSAS
jgi:hypothetical protein